MHLQIEFAKVNDYRYEKDNPHRSIGQLEGLADDANPVVVIVE